MSSEIPSLPNPVPARLSEAPETDESAAARPVQAAGEEETAGKKETETGDRPAPEVSKPPSEPPRPARPSRPAPAKSQPAAPAMPAMPVPADDDEDDDDEIPDEDEMERLLAGGPAGDAPAEAEPEGVLQGVVVTVRDDGAFVDVGEKAEAFLPFAAAKSAKRPDWKPGDSIEVVVTGRSPEGYLLLTSTKGQRPQEWSQLELAHASDSIVIGKVLEVVKGGLAVDVGVRAFLPASRSGERDQESLEALVGREIRARVAQLDVEDQNAVLDRRSVLEDEREQRRQEAVSGLRPGAIVKAVVRTIRDFGAFVDIGGMDALLHVSDISWGRTEDIRAVLKEGDELDVEVLRVEDEGRRIAVGRKQLEPDPWTVVAEKIKAGDRIRGTVTRVKDFGAFVELTPGAEGLIHVSEMSWTRRVRHPSDVVSVGDTVDAVVLDVNLGAKRIGLGLKQALGDPWDRVESETPVGSAVEGVVRKITSFGAFVEVREGVEGLLHISDITSERRLNHPSEVLKVDDKLRVKILEFDREKRRLKLGLKQLEPTELDKYLESIQEGDTVTGRVARVRGDEAEVELDEGVRGVCRLESAESAARTEASAGESSAAADVSSLGARLQAAWKQGAAPSAGEAGAREGELRSFQVERIDRERRLISLRPA